MGKDPFPRGWSGTFDLPNFPTSGETTVVQWAESLQNFVITDGQPHTGEGYNQVAGCERFIGKPVTRISPEWSRRDFRLGVRGRRNRDWNSTGCPTERATRRPRPDTLGRCGDTDNGFSLLWNWNNLGAGTHTVRALIDGQEFANTTVHVTTFGEESVPTGLEWARFSFRISPHPGENKRLRWEESLQNFVIVP